MKKFVKRVELDDLRRGDFVIVRWRDASNTRGSLEELEEPQWVKDWGFYMGIVGRYPQLILSKDVSEAHPAWGVTRIPVELMDEIWLWITCDETRQVIPELRTSGRRILTRRYNRTEFLELVTRGA